MSGREQAVEAAWKVLDGDPDYEIALTQDLVRIPSVNPKFVQDPEQNKEAEVQDRIERETRGFGCTTERWDVFPGRPNLISEFPGSEERSLILCGHVDVVPVGQRSDWSVDPFGGEIKNGRIYGRGAVDMKAGVVSCIAAARAIRKAGIELEGRLSIHTVVDEEAGGFGAMDAVAKGKLAKGAIVAEPTWDNVLPCEGGLYWTRITIRGRQAHAGMRFNEIWPQHDFAGRTVPGVNVIELMTRFLTAMREFESIRCRTSDHPLVPPGLNTISPGVVRAGAGLGEDGLPVVMTNPAIIPDVAVIDVDYKFLPNEDPDEVRKEFETFVHHFCQQDRWLRENPISVEWKLGGLYFPPMDTPVDHPLVRSLIEHKTSLGKTPSVRGFEAVTDAAHYAGAGVDAVIFGASGDGFHGKDEYVDIASLKETTKVIAATIIDWCGVR
ncbi:acetylornithine deacetylase [Mesorhizobium sp. J18]|uniref:M20 family metallopeptidase n=1 Tax=Mesorhizobium sp. J18 TaxID=935263 RepID=UPI00119BD713|nr:ArgE/DapE family deacylase [Mesorhizobium sp. J18]TWG95962.1 acetylornithine deacetylase [Mesorhizobium sp. J18]